MKKTKIILSLIWILLYPHLFNSMYLIAEHLDQDDVILVDTINSNRICFHRNIQNVDSLQSIIIEKLKLSVHEIGKIIDVTDVEFRVLIFPERTLPSKGISGVAPNTEHIYLLLDLDHPRLFKSIEEELVATMAHEYHHTLRKRAIGNVKTLFDAIISEGLADHFAIEVTGEQPPWATPVDEEIFAKWQKKAEEEWFNEDFDYFAWFIGLNSDIPRGTGYEIGRRIVAEYLEKYPNKKPSTLFMSPSSDFLSDNN